MRPHDSLVRQQLSALEQSSDIAFLRDRCSVLQNALGGRLSEDEILDEVVEGAVLRRWAKVLVPETPWPAATQLALEELYVLQARILERVIRGGVGDISPHVEQLARAVWIDRLQRVTDEAVSAIRAASA